MRLRIPLVGASLVLGLGAMLPLSGGAGCGRTACFEYTQGEYAANGNSCPAQADALGEFTSATCPGPVVAVQGAGTFDGELCCYPVAQEDIVPDCGHGGSTSTETDTSTFTEVGTISEPGTDTSTGIDACGPDCAISIMEGMPPCSGPGLSAFTALQACASTECPMVCGDFAISGFLDTSCLSCVSQSCAAQFMSCLSS